MRAQERIAQKNPPDDGIGDSEPGSIWVHSVSKPEQDADRQDGREWPHLLYE